MTSPTSASGPIGIFDSGVGGLTVLSAIRERLPNEALLYLGDMARLPYGSKGPETIMRYAEKAARYLIENGAKMLVIACNTASAHAIEHLRALFPTIPVVGVVEPGAQAACRAADKGRIVVIATEGTVRSRAYERAILNLRKDARVTSLSCPLFVALAEEGLVEGHILDAIARHYFGSHFDVEAEGGPGEVLVLGCTHFPLLAKGLRDVLGPGVKMVDSASATADMVQQVLAESRLSAPVGERPGNVAFFTTDSTDRFARIASMLFPGLVDKWPVWLVDI